MKIIDSHAHIYPEAISQRAVENVGAFYQMNMKGSGTAENLIDMGKQAGITSFVVCSPALTANRVESINTFIHNVCKDTPELIGYGTLHADYENPEAEIARIKALGLRGVKIHPDSQQFNLDDPRMMRIYGMLESAGLPVLFHTGDYRYDCSHPRRLVHVLHTFPKLTCIAAHFGGWSVFDLALEYLLDENCYLDMSSAFAFLGMQRAKELISLYTPRRMLFGSDFPMWDPREELEKFFSMGFSDQENEAMLSGNISEILQLPN